MIAKKDSIAYIVAFSMITAGSILPTQSFATEEQCRSVLHDCDSALQAERTENGLQKQIIADQNKRYADVSSELKSEEFWRPIAISGITLALLEGLILAFKK